MHDELVGSANAYYIKLGAKGGWEEPAIKDGFLILGYESIPHEKCKEGRWDELRPHFGDLADPGSVTRHISQIRAFYEAPTDAIWVTFHADSMWWCQATAEIVVDQTGVKRRKTVNGWSNKDRLGRPLLKSQLSGKLLAVEAFRGTICAIAERQYLVHKLNGTSEPRVEAARADFDRLVESAVTLIRNLHAKDFETLIDLIFRQSGWQRTGVAGETVKDIDLDLISPITKERIAVQIKARASKQVYADYLSRLSRMESYSRRYLITHSPSADLSEMVESKDELEIWTDKDIARLTVSTGLIEWLLDKAG